jgi:hypothetical protein
MGVVGKDRLTVWAVALGLTLFAAGAVASEASRAARPDPNKADTSRAARESAEQSIPLDKLTPDGKNKAAWALNNASIFRRMPLRVVQCDPSLYLFLVQHPDVVVNVWEVLGASNLALKQVAADTFQVTDEIGTTGGIQYLYRSKDLNIAYFDGTYKGSLFNQEVHARGLIVLKTAYSLETDGRYYVTSRLDAFVNIEPGGMEFLTKTFQPVVGKVADGNFVQTAWFVGSLSRTAEVNQSGMQRLAGKLTKVKPEVRQQFSALIEQVAKRAPAETSTQTAHSTASPLEDTRTARRSTPLPVGPASSANNAQGPTP